MVVIYFRINDKVDKKSNKNNKSKSSDLCPNDSFNSDNITVNDYNKPNVISTEKYAIIVTIISELLLLILHFIID